MSRVVVVVGPDRCYLFSSDTISYAMLDISCGNSFRWGAHYMRTLPLMLLAERRSNFRDQVCAVSEEHRGWGGCHEMSRRT